VLRRIHPGVDLSLESGQMAPKARARPSRALEGENLATSHWEDARHWMSIYADLLEFKRGILDRVRSDVASLQPLARKADVQVYKGLNG
jgi:hypothetical protein